MNSKLSHYVFFTEEINSRGSRVAYSTRSGKTLLVTKTCYEFLSNDLLDHIPESILKVLSKNRIIVDKDENELEVITNENIAEGLVEEGTFYEVIQPSAMCQLGCYYCGQKHTKDYLSDEMINRLVERLKFKFEKGKYNSIYIGWFGGEPLMGLPQMRLIYKRLKEAINNESIPIKGRVITNGLSLKQGVYNELVKDLGINYIEITLDGIKAYHDKHRYTKGGEDSFDIIYGNIKKITSDEHYLSSGCRIGIRCNVDYKNVEGVVPLIDLLADDGMQDKLGGLYFMGIYSWGGNEAHKEGLSKEEIGMMQLKWQIHKVKRGFKPELSLYARKMNTCIATSATSEMYDAFGNIFNCTEVSYADFYDGKGYKLGNLAKDSLEVFTGKPYNDWFQTVRDTDKFPCHSCKLLPVCGGSCPKSWNEGNIPCPPFKYNILKEIELKYILRKTPKSELNDKLDEFILSFKPSDFNRIGS